MATFDFAAPDVDLNDPAAVDAYDELTLWSAFAGQLLLRHLGVARAAKVLDVGCGTGFPAIELAERFGRGSAVVGLDTWGEGLRRARGKAASRNVRNVWFVKGDARAMPFADCSFDLITSNVGINNFDDPMIALRECRRVAGRGARLMLTTNLKGHWDHFYSVFESIVDASVLPELRRHIDHRTTVDQLSASLRAARFDVLRIEQERVPMTFADGSAFLGHSFIRLAFFPAWRSLIPVEHREATFERLEAALNAQASAQSGLQLTVPFAYVEAAAAPTDG